MDLVDLKRGLKAHDMKSSTILQIISKIQTIPDYIKLKQDVELTLFVCNLIENTIKKHMGFNKKEMVINILNQLFNLTPDEKKAIENQIEFLFLNKKIKVMGKVKFISKVLFSWVKKKVL